MTSIAGYAPFLRFSYGLYVLMVSYSSFFAGLPHSSYSPTVSGRVGSLIVFRTSTNGTWATTAWKRSGRMFVTCLLYTSDAADDLLCVDLGGRRIIKKKK